VAFQRILNQPGAYRLLLEQYPEVVYMYVFETLHSAGPYMDYLQPDLQIAMTECEKRYGVKTSDWTLVPDEGWHD
jgi:hypothetical protein